MGRSIFDSFGSNPTPPASGGNPFMQVMTIVNNNPAAFLKQKFPDIPEEIMYNPTQILQYLQQTRGGISDQDIQQIQQNPMQFLQYLQQQQMQNGGFPWQR